MCSLLGVLSGNNGLLMLQGIIGVQSAGKSSCEQRPADASGNNRCAVGRKFSASNGLLMLQGIIGVQSAGKSSCEQRPADASGNNRYAVCGEVFLRATAC